MIYSSYTKMKIKYIIYIWILFLRFPIKLQGFFVGTDETFLSSFFLQIFKTTLLRGCWCLFPVPDIRYVLCLIILSFLFTKILFNTQFQTNFEAQFLRPKVTSYNPPWDYPGILRAHSIWPVYGGLDILSFSAGAYVILWELHVNF